MGERLLTLSILSCLLMRMVTIMVIMGDVIVSFSSNIVIQSLFGGHMVIMLV